MRGETILVIEDSPAELDIAQTSLEDAGYRVRAAANAAAATTCPDIQDINLIVMDQMLDGISGIEATRMLRQEPQSHPIPILLLIPDDGVDRREDLSLRGANGYLLKPYDSRSLVKKVATLLEQQHLEDLARQYLTDATDALMDELAENHIKEAVERKTQIIIERCIQNVATAVDKRASEVVQEQVTALTAEKEQELIKATVREVAQSMVEKLAERKVTEAMETVLPQECERAVRRAADQTLPSTIRERLKESMNSLLPREIQNRLQKAAEKMVPEMSQQLVATVESVAAKSIPRISRDILPDIAERQFRTTISEKLPRQVGDLVGRELDQQMSDRIEPAIRDAARSLRRTVFIYNIVTGAVVALALGLTVYFQFFAGS